MRNRLRITITTTQTTIHVTLGSSRVIFNAARQMQILSFSCCLIFNCCATWVCVSAYLRSHSLFICTINANIPFFGYIFTEKTESFFSLNCFFFNCLNSIKFFLIFYIRNLTNIKFQNTIKSICLFYLKWMKTRKKQTKRKLI